MSKRLLIAIILLLSVLPAAADQVILDDLVVDGSACIGFDCVNGEDFGFDTLILKENNLRVYFQDTSSTSAFPSTDWRITVNDSANGGKNHFSVSDVSSGITPLTILGGSGAIGLGTASPEMNLHVSVGDTPTMRFGQTGELGWDPYAWDVGGNEASYFVRDATAGTVPFRIESGAADESMVIDVDGNVSIVGTLSQGSSRFIKNIQPIAAETVLARLEKLEVSEWQYRNDTRQSTHLGPMAEDFYQLFALGLDDKHIAASDVAGVAIASVQALAKKVDSQARELEQVREHNAALEARLARIEAMLAN